MLERFPNYYHQFTCIAGDCPDTCCVGWDILVDDEAAARYACMEGPLGAELREAMVIDEDGDRVLRMVEGDCPMLNAAHLCRIQLAHGHEALCKVCRTFPRLQQDYETFVEHGLSLSCPAAAALVLNSTDDRWIEVGTLEPAVVEYDAELLRLLQETREPLLRLLRDDARPVGDSLALALLYAYAVQDAIDGEALVFDPERELAALPQPQKRDFAPMIAFHRDLELLTDRWAAKLAGAGEPGTWPAETRSLAAYYVNRYWLQAVSDRDPVWRVKQMLTACLMARVLPDAIVLYSKEVEHDGDNVDRIWEACYSDPAWSDLALLDWLRFSED